MKIVTLDELKKMPDGTLYAPYEPCVFLSNPVVIVGHYDNKPGGGWNGGISLLSIDADFCNNMKLDFDTWDDCHADYCNDDSFAVFEPDDIDVMIKLLQYAKGDIEYKELKNTINKYSPDEEN